MTRFLARTFATTLLAASLSFGIHAQEKDSQGGTATDFGFYKNAYASGTTEIAASELALKQTKSDKVRTFAQTMVTDHTAANRKLEDLKSGDKGYSRAEQPTPEGAKMIDALSRLQGAEFDRAYAKMMIADHETAVAAFEVEIEKGSNPELKAFAKETLPKLKHHLQMAKTLTK